MRKFLVCFAVVVMLLLTACGEDTSDVDVNISRDHEANFTSTWAKTPDYFFFIENHIASQHPNFALYRLPLADITQGERVNVPGDGEIEILGFNEQYLFLSRNCGNWEERIYHIYRLSLITLRATLIDTGHYYGVGRFHAASNSILFPHADLETGLVGLEALQLDTGERSIVYEFESANFASFNSGWWQMERGALVFINSSWGAAEPLSNFIFIDFALQAKQIQHDEIENAHPPSVSNDTHFAIVYTGYWGDSNEVEAVLLDEHGDVKKVLAVGWYGHNLVFRFEEIPNTDMIMVKQRSFFRLDGWVQAVYDTASGALFSVTDQ